jgi:hypothetical protein
VSWWDEFWVQTYSGIAAGLAVAFILALGALVATIVKASWREKVWGNVARFFRWAGGLRVSTAARRRDVAARLAAADVSKAAALALIARAEEMMKTTNAQAEELKRHVQARTQGAGVVAVSAPPAQLMREPRWQAYADPDGEFGSFMLRNLVEGSVAYEVRLEAAEDTFQFLDGAHFDEVSGDGSVATFRGEILSPGWQNGVTLWIAWLDKAGGKRSTTTQLRPPETPF